jgi:histidyl-tRNA synthetase
MISNRNLSETSEAGKIAKFYGFQPIASPNVEKHDLEHVKNLDETHHGSEKGAMVRTYFEEKLYISPQPNMFYCERPFPGSKESKKPSKLEASLISIGSPKSVCECLSIQTALAILHSLGYKNLEVEVNSIGDKDSAIEFQKKMTAFVRKNMASFPADLRQEVKKDLYAVFRADKEEWAPFAAEAPKSIDFLSEQSRIHFKEVLEFLETLSLPYNINHSLIGDPVIGSETIFAIKETDGDKDSSLALGFRFNRLAKKMGYKKDLPATTLNISVKLKKKMKRIKIRNEKPKFYLIQFGAEAKLKSFLLLEELRKAGTSVCHAIAKDKLGSQMGAAESSEAAYILLLGQKEALENSVVIRNTQTRAQEIVPILDFCSRIKEILQ